jgi:hypothetical protein
MRATSKFALAFGLLIVYAMSRPSGDQSGWRSFAGFVVRRRSPVPSGLIVNTSPAGFWPIVGSVRKLANAIRPLKTSARAGAQIARPSTSVVSARPRPTAADHDLTAH